MNGLTIKRYDVFSYDMLPCPVCGSDDVQVDITEFRYPDQTVFECNPVCNNCSHELEDHPSILDAIEEWNEQR